MPRINLLPWRETLKQEREIRFGIITATALVCAGLIVLGVHIYMQSWIGYQKERNAYLDREIQEADKKIAEIEELDKYKTGLVNRMNVIQELQKSRPKVVHLFDELVRQIPDGVYFTSMKQKDSTITLAGVAQSEARVSSLMRNVEKSAYLTSPKIIVIEAKDQKNTQNNTSRGVHIFQLETMQIKEKDEFDQPKPKEQPTTKK